MSFKQTRIRCLQLQNRVEIHMWIKYWINVDADIGMRVFGVYYIAKKRIYRIELGNFTLFLGGRETFRPLLLIVSSSACLPLLTFSGLVFRTSEVIRRQSCVRDRSIKQATNFANLGWFLIQMNHRPIYRVPSKSIDNAIARDLAWEKFKKKKRKKKDHRGYERKWSRYLTTIYDRHPITRKRLTV